MLARRLSNAEFDYTIRDLTGVDIRPARDFPVDPADEAGFDNTGESLTMSPALLEEALGGGAAGRRPRRSHAGRPRVRAVPGRYGHRPGPLLRAAHYRLLRASFGRLRRLLPGRLEVPASSDRADVDLGRFAADAGLSAKYLSLVWSALTEDDAEAGPLTVVRSMWNDLPGPGQEAAARGGCERMRDVVVRLRRQLKPKLSRLHVEGISDGSQPFVLWSDRQSAARHRNYSGDVFADLRKLSDQLEGRGRRPGATARAGRNRRGRRTPPARP